MSMKTQILPGKNSLNRVRKRRTEIITDWSDIDNMLAQANVPEEKGDINSQLRLKGPGKLSQNTVHKINFGSLKISDNQIRHFRVSQCKNQTKPNQANEFKIAFCFSKQFGNLSLQLSNLNSVSLLTSGIPYSRLESRCESGSITFQLRNFINKIQKIISTLKGCCNKMMMEFGI